MGRVTFDESPAPLNVKCHASHVPCPMHLSNDHVSNMLSSKSSRIGENHLGICNRDDSRIRALSATIGNAHAAVASDGEWKTDREVVFTAQKRNTGLE